MYIGMCVCSATNPAHTHMTCTWSAVRGCGRLWAWRHVQCRRHAASYSHTHTHTHTHRLEDTHTHRLEDFVVLEQLLAFREERLSRAQYRGRSLVFIHGLYEEVKKQGVNFTFKGRVFIRKKSRRFVDNVVMTTLLVNVNKIDKSRGRPRESH